MVEASAYVISRRIDKHHRKKDSTCACRPDVAKEAH